MIYISGLGLVSVWLCGGQGRGKMLRWSVGSSIQQSPRQHTHRALEVALAGLGGPVVPPEGLVQLHAHLLFYVLIIYIYIGVWVFVCV